MASTRSRKQSRHTLKTWIRGEEIRRDSVSHSPDSSGGSILVATKGKRIQYAPEVGQAWISTSEFADEGLASTIDLRSAGFPPPLRNIADWLKNRCDILNVGPTKDSSGRSIIRIEARAKMSGKAAILVTSDFVPTMNSMPSRVVVRFLPNGGVFIVTDIEYHQVSSSGAWFPLRITQRHFPRNTTADPDAPSGQNITEQSTVKILAINQGMQDEDFDPILPAKTLLLPWHGSCSLI